eukprot:CAMPEP_0201714438 /NCGR_PEP_ID=MMETSP0593-20130828/926_1 /ASSEMBLY_ACC=CAM_ASM_000672 /TAXON_ID=267983 /ORGANISM="Skeletonema japonicum, Strain CCMP2506" /LENGTH=197 /DNA_ID=CAMNT_0048203721 /DNA_START=156 /DNA_END=746 /DNA_ORIENTATION=-
MTSSLPKTLLFRRVASPLSVAHNHHVARGYAYKSFSASNNQDDNILINLCICIRRKQATPRRSLSSSPSSSFGLLQQQQQRTQQQRTLSSVGASQQPPVKLTFEQRTALSSTILSKKSRFPGGWKIDPSGRDAITKTFNFIDFKQAWDFMSQIAIVAEQMNHHPEWMNVYNRVEVTLTTHDVDGLSNYDIEMAQKMD